MVVMEDESVVVGHSSVLDDPSSSVHEDTVKAKDLRSHTRDEYYDSQPHSSSGLIPTSSTVAAAAALASHRAWYDHHEVHRDIPTPSAGESYQHTNADDVETYFRNSNAAYFSQMQNYSPSNGIQQGMHENGLSTLTYSRFSSPGSSRLSIDGPGEPSASLVANGASRSPTNSFYSPIHSMWNSPFVPPQSPATQQSSTTSRYSPVPPTSAFGYPIPEMKRESNHHPGSPVNLRPSSPKSTPVPPALSLDSNCQLTGFEKSSADSFMSSLGFNAAAAYSAMGAAAVGSRKLPPPEGNNHSANGSLEDPDGSYLQSNHHPPPHPIPPLTSDQAPLSVPASGMSSPLQSTTDEPCLIPQQSVNNGGITASTPYPYFTSPNTDLSSPFYGSCTTTGMLPSKSYSQRRPKGRSQAGKPHWSGSNTYSTKHLKNYNTGFGSHLCPVFTAPSSATTITG